MSYSEEDIDLLKSAIQYSFPIAPSEVENGIAYIERGDKDPILALIVMRRTKLKKLELGRCYQHTNGTDRYLLQTLGCITDSSETQALESDTNDRIRFSRSANLSSVSDLVLDQFDIDLDEISRLLRTMNELKSFSYFANFHSFLWIVPICKELLACSKHSLRKLCLHSLDGNESYAGEITHFEIFVEI